MVSRGVTLTTTLSPGILLRGWDVLQVRREESKKEWERKRLHSALTGLGIEEGSARASVAAALSSGGAGECPPGKVCGH